MEGRLAFPLVSSFADLLRELRTARSLTQEELAKRAGITVKAVSALERGDRRRPYPHTVRSLADALELGETDRDRLVSSVPGRGATGRAVVALPVPPGPVLGRDADVEAVAELVLATPRRLVTLTGPGGVGKTTLALTVAARVADPGKWGPGARPAEVGRRASILVGTRSRHENRPAARAQGHRLAEARS